MAMPKPAKDVSPIVAELEKHGCSFTIDGGAMIIHDPNKFLNVNPGVKERVVENKVKMLAHLQHRALVRILQVVEMAQPEIPNGMKEDFLLALSEGAKLVGGDIWED